MKVKGLRGFTYMDHGHDSANVTLWGLKYGRILKRRVDGPHTEQVGDSVCGHYNWAKADGIGCFIVSGRIDHGTKVITVGDGGIHNKRQVAYAIKRLEKQYPDHEFLVAGDSYDQWEEINRC